jgi:hypothetical protein
MEVVAQVLLLLNFIFLLIRNQIFTKVIMDGENKTVELKS